MVVLQHAGEREARTAAKRDVHELKPSYEVTAGKVSVKTLPCDAPGATDSVAL